MIKLSGMRSLQLLRHVAGALLLAGMLAGCDTEESCFSASGNEYRIAFYVLNEESVFVQGPFFFDRIDVLRSGSPYYTFDAEGTSGVSLALDPAADTSTFVFRYEESADTIVIGYDRIYNLISADCGAEIQFKDLRIYSHTFDSLRTITSELSGTDTGFDLAIYKVNACTSSFPDFVHAGFKTINEAGEEIPAVLNFNEIRATGVDSALYSGPANGISSIDLPLNPAAERAEYIFISGETSDTLAIDYNVQQKAVNVACGLQEKFTDITISGNNSFTSVRINYTELSADNQGFDIEIVK